MHVAVVGLGFGRAFVPLYRDHPVVNRLTLCDPAKDAIEAARIDAPEARTARDLGEVLSDPSVDCVHLLSPLPYHYQQQLQVLEAGLHCACAVTMGQSTEEIRGVVDAVRRSDTTYMMMETGVYTREFLLAKAMREAGELGDITYLRGDYFQDLDATYPEYWKSVPPMHYTTHITGPMLALAGTRAIRVSCIGAGRARNGMPPLQTAHFLLDCHDAVMQVTRAWYQAARQYVEGFCVYGDKKGFEWQQLEHEGPVVFELEPVHMTHRWRDCPGNRVEAPFRPDLLPNELKPHAEGGHGGSHAQLVHEFVSAVAEGRKSAVDEVTAANWCAAGICANLSSERDGEWVTVPSFS
jgi:predicted dehydrogenase